MTAAKQSLFKKISVINLLVIFWGTVILALKWQSLPEKVPLFYSRPWGEEQLASSKFLFSLPLLSLVILIGNGILGSVKVKSKKNDRFLTTVGASFSLLFSLLAALTIVKIILLLS